uniref:hypothetical protein Ycf33 n=1 Tax=Sargassum polycystum TaxID=127578 RepID=UPI0020C8B8B2|nr:hypothetical protein Ycf33 [Sargassum polycystum]YP_010418196.1 hypothetical protein Ycf33 [Sargassum plagiophyllum]USF18319.1 hypothetical protein Ycf33 [Sargassum polycystum]USF18414.1 hypothetical protein Ycf33 [Sargassum plagiophyllum]
MIFWDNLLRYPRFFISSMFGLILILLSPFINQSKKVNRKVIFFFLSIIIVLLYILKQMVSLE